eukprot:1497063-Amphidinium_carterae.1
MVLVGFVQRLFLFDCRFGRSESESLMRKAIEQWTSLIGGGMDHRAAQAKWDSLCAELKVSGAPHNYGGSQHSPLSPHV